jgi:penicillin-insensitive murein endopeptidase
MLSGHASHQIGLDADIWFTPMPSRTLTAQEREAIPFTSMLDKSKFLTVDPKRWTQTHARLVMQAASYPQVDRVFVNPAIKKKLCETWMGDRSALGKVRPIYGHDEHFHIRIKCPAGAEGCKPQAAVPTGDGCDKSLAWWFTKEPWEAPKKDPNAKPVKPRPVLVSDLPKACAAVLATPSADGDRAVFNGAAAAPQKTVESIITADPAVSAPATVPVPASRPSLN